MLKILAKLFENLETWGAQGKMTQFKLIVNSLPRDLLEFSFFLAVGITAGSLGLIWTYLTRILYCLMQWNRIPLEKSTSNISWSFLICFIVEIQEISK